MQQHIVPVPLPVWLQHVGIALSQLSSACCGSIAARRSGPTRSPWGAQGAGITQTPATALFLLVMPGLSSLKLKHRLRVAS